jgi:hypothetical protein
MAFFFVSAAMSRLRSLNALVDEVFKMRFVDQRFEQRARRRLFREIVFDQFDALTFQVSHRIAAARSTWLEIHLHAFAHFFLTHQASPPAIELDGGGGHVPPQCSSSICCTSGVQLPPHCPIVAVVRAAIWEMDFAPSRMARSIVRYLMLLHRQTVFKPRTAGCKSSECSIPTEANTLDSLALSRQRVRLAKSDLPGRFTRGCPRFAVEAAADVGRPSRGSLRESENAPLAVRGFRIDGLRKPSWYACAIECARRDA